MFCEGFRFVSTKTSNILLNYLSKTHLLPKRPVGCYSNFALWFPPTSLPRAGARTLIGGGGECMFISSGSARLISFKINFISKETSRADPEYMNIHPSPIKALAPALPPTKC